MSGYYFDFKDESLPERWCEVDPRTTGLCAEFLTTYKAWDMLPWTEFSWSNNVGPSGEMGIYFTPSAKEGLLFVACSGARSRRRDDWHLELYDETGSIVMANSSIYPVHIPKLSSVEKYLSEFRERHLPAIKERFSRHGQQQ